ncbi:hypothetical protein SCHPADRAFT_46683 [Schizopora paradoxa]|uniref:Uncharacterized protein n=1 Tax=Schizopora paradoxa TaxID=27342 RepID=A0A0H2S7K7_9AGAM|nr:hypothetical protein SCHPADRAFT_46683 [Schizopora paradoxa]
MIERPTACRLPGSAPFPIQAPLQMFDRARTRSPGNDLATMPFVCGPRRRRLAVEASLSRASPCRRLRGEPSRVDRGRRRSICVWGRSTLGDGRAFHVVTTSPCPHQGLLFSLSLSSASYAFFCYQLIKLVVSWCTIQCSLRSCSSSCQNHTNAKFLSTKYKWE